MKIQILSPHLDDAVLSCGEHILRWQEHGHTVEVITLFTQFTAPVFSEDSQLFMKKAKVSSGDHFHQQRMSEDKKALKILGIEHSTWLDEVDGGFRTLNEHPVYPSYNKLFSGDILDHQEWLQHLRTKLSQSIDRSAAVIVPLAVGRHADHILVRNIASQIVSPERIGWYVDAPYFFQLSNWDADQLKALFFLNKSMQWSSEKKLSAVAAYSSQLSSIFQGDLWEYPEVIITKNATLRNL